MSQAKGIIAVVIGLVLFLTAIDGFYIVHETEQVIITQFGDPVGEAITQPGLKFKIPFMQTANFFEKRYLEWDGDRNQIPTRDKKFIFVDSYARWQITDPLQFYQRLGNERGAQSRLDDILDGETRNAIASHDLLEIVRTSNREPDTSGAAILEVVEDSLETIETGRGFIQDEIQEKGNERAKDLGIVILDFRIKRVNYVEDVRQTVYDRMISERNRIADEFRSEGQGEASRINGEKERDLARIQSEAFREAEIIRGNADAQAAAIYNAAYNKSPQARELYSFMRSMNAYVKTMDDQTNVILSTDSDFFRYLNRID
ncbi:MAG: protease modulator HflC [Gracilimonas sp.]|uniref:Protein HflC n=1 Tax=Gracilimonas sediminicola TaxID=2952158 RepID=A0A9X2L254_9BACT|nr:MULTISPECIES: protease modulator HflC [Gracilimonas]MBO6587429.1 protease modulator HflC [Gracilimonas sp.]MBO6617056.1 protease modulator HflC [Gracilimonas sp.]MCP9290870.1 protease modulator HflC [Gracilimonas sediminicola]